MLTYKLQEMSRKAKKNLLWVLVLLVASVWIIVQQNEKKAPYRNNAGLVFGTVYNVTYQSDDTLNVEIRQALDKVDDALSMFNKSSVVSKINANTPVQIDSLFARCFNRAMYISKQTNGDFDITVCPLVNAWGFGFKSRQFPTDDQIQDLLQIVGYQKVRFDGKQIVKSNPLIMLDFSAIAKGYGVDMAAKALSDHGVKNYMVDIGGEVVLKGKNMQNKLWKIGINKPIDDSTSVNNEIDRVLYLTDCAIATSGNYRNYYYHNGKKYSHEINPHTGYPAMNEILSATVIAKDCMSADGYATSFMVMGLQRVKAFLAAHPELDAYIIYRGENNKNKIFYSKGMDKYFKNKQ